MIENSFSEESTIHLTPKNKNGTTDNAIINDEIIIEENGINVIEIGEGEDVNIFDTNLIYEDNELISTENNINNSLNNLSNIWKDSNKKNINFLLEKLSRNLSSSIIKLNLINSLVYGNVPPSDMTQSEFDKLRIITLKNLGDIDSAIIVISNIDTYESNKDLYDKIILEKSLSDYNIAAVCGILDSNSNFNNDSFLLKTKIFCSILNGDYETADFLNSLLVEEDYDEFFQILFNKLIDVDKSENNYDIKNYKYDIDSISLYSAIMRSTDTPFSADFFKLNSPQLLKAIAISPVTDISIRLEAAQKAFYYNSLNAESIAALYQSVDFSNSGFTIKWSKSSDGDFKFYTLEHSIESQMNDYEEILTTEDINLTSTRMENTNPLIFHYFRVTVTDTFDYQTKGSIYSSSLDPVPDSVDVKSVTYDFEKMTVEWDKSNIGDFGSYKLLYSKTENGDRDTITTYTDNITSYSTESYNPLIENWYWVVVSDTLGQTSTGNGKSNSIEPPPQQHNIVSVKYDLSSMEIEWYKTNEWDIDYYELL